MSAPASGLRVALGEYDTGWHDPELSLERAAALIGRAASAGADLVVLPEMCTTGFTMDAAVRAEPIGGRGVQQLATLAKLHRVHLLAGVATRERVAASREEFYNSALLFAPDGGLVTEYRKQELYVSAGENEIYTAGAGPVIVEVGGVRISPFICFDLRFPELFRAVSPGVDAIVLIANWPTPRRFHWDVLVRARAIENQCYLIAVNRIGEGGGLLYDGGSVAYDPFGERLTEPLAGAADDRGAPVVTIDPERVGRVRREFPFVPDQRR